MRRSSSHLGLVCLFVFGLVFAWGTAKETTFTFDNNLEGLTVHRGFWHWSDRASVGWKVPAGGDGFALYNTTREGDELYSQFTPLDFGLNYSITYFMASKYAESTTFALHKLTVDGVYLETIHDYYNDSRPTNKQWMTVTGYVPPGPDTLFSTFCQTEYQNPDEVNGYLWGCAIDSMVLTTGPDLGASTKAEPMA